MYIYLCSIFKNPYCFKCKRYIYIYVKARVINVLFIRDVYRTTRLNSFRHVWRCACNRTSCSDRTGMEIYFGFCYFSTKKPRISSNNYPKSYSEHQTTYLQPKPRLFRLLFQFDPVFFGQKCI